MNWASYLLSLCLHLAVFLLIMFWPSSPPVNLETPPVMISLVDGAPGGNRTPSSILGKMGKPTDGPKDVSPPAKKADAAAPERPEVKADPTADKARPVEAKPEPKVERKPDPKHEVKPKPEPKDATPVAEKKDKKKKEDKKKDDDKKTDKKADKPSKGDPVAAAMNQARREATSRVESGDKGSSVEQALAQARRNAGGDGGGGGGEGDGPGGGGLNDVYMGQVMLAVRPNWSFTSATRLNLVCVVRVKVNLQGEVEKVDVTQSSGNAQYDSSAANAIWRTSRAGAFPPPPSEQYTELDLVFTLNELMGR